MPWRAASAEIDCCGWRLLKAESRATLHQERVTVDGRLASIGDKADPDTQSIRVDGFLLTTERAPIVLLLNKPVGYVCTCHDPHGRSTVLDLIRNDFKVGFIPLGVWTLIVEAPYYSVIW